MLGSTMEMLTHLMHTIGLSIPLREDSLSL